jgi:hypothetical protein
MNWETFLNGAERLGFLLLAWHGLALMASLLAWLAVGVLKRRSCKIRSWIVRAMLTAALLVPMCGLVVNCLPQRDQPAATAAAEQAAANGEAAMPSVDWNRVAVWKPLMAIRALLQE